jgi:hypothetical protein
VVKDATLVLGAAAPVNIVDTGSAFDSARNPEPGIALCLPEVRYRAMLFISARSGA